MKNPFLLLIVALALIGCGGGDGLIGTIPPSEYVEAKQRWSRAGVESYQFTIRTLCFCVPEGPISVVVRNGAVQGAIYVNTGAPVGGERLSHVPTHVPTLSGLFDIADAAYSRRAAEVRFTSNAEYGYFENLYIDYDRGRADDEIGYMITNLVINDE